MFREIAIISLLFGLITSVPVYDSLDFKHDHCRTPIGIGCVGVAFTILVIILSRLSSRFTALNMKTQVLLIILCSTVFFFIEFGTRSSCTKQPENGWIVLGRNTIVFFVMTTILYVIARPYIRAQCIKPQQPEVPVKELYESSIPKIIDLENNKYGMMTQPVSLEHGKEIGNMKMIKIRYKNTPFDTKTIMGAEICYITITATNAKTVVRKSEVSDNNTWYIIHLLHPHECNKDGQLFIVRGVDRKKDVIAKIDEFLVQHQGVKGMSTPLNTDKRPAVNAIDKNVVNDPIVAACDRDTLKKLFTPEAERNPFNNTMDEKGQYEREKGYVQAQRDTILGSRLV